MIVQIDPVIHIIHQNGDRERDKWEEEEGRRGEEIYLEDAGVRSNGNRKSCFEDKMSKFWKRHSSLAGEVPDTPVSSLSLCCHFSMSWR